jgi:hypothetical protein
MDKTESSSRADSQPPWADLTSVSLRLCKESNTLQMWHTKCVHRIWYPLEALVILQGDALVAYCHQTTPETMEMILANLGCVTQEPIILAMQNKA